MARLHLLRPHLPWLYSLRLHLKQHVGEAPGNQTELELLRDLAAQIEHALRQPLEAALHLVRVRVRIRVRG